jgi:radical SAM protein with 4Fe4S-binding SPASM domain
LVTQAGDVLILDNTVTTFVFSSQQKQLSSRRPLFYMPERLDGYDLDSDRVIQRTISPVSVALCPTSACVRKCYFCSNTQRNELNRITNTEYSEAVFDSLTDDLDLLRVRGVSVAGGGEPLVYRKPAFNRFLTREASFRIGIHTNGALLGRILREDILKAGSIEYINVSVVAHRPELYEKVCSVDRNQFLEVEKWLKRAMELQHCFATFPTFGVKILVCRRNYKYLKEMKDYFLGLGIGNVLIRCVGNFEPGQDVELSEAQYAEITPILKRDLGMNQDQIEAITGKTSTFPPIPSRCWIMGLQYTAGVDPDGEVYLCSPWSRKEFSIGNVNSQRFSGLWSGPKHKEVAQMLNSKMRCGECNPLLCRHYYSNLAIDALIAGAVDPLPKDKLEAGYGRFI